ncbi:MAG: glycosyl transferase [Deltaproteobacteria bacterium]|nr:glycosyl transferase [Deltaproteobacteria bacterium]MDL1961617.1 glycosyl transferase [Deltaproteobacteria bacterium]
MSTFYQGNMITTIHDLYEVFDRSEYEKDLQKKLQEFSEHTRICLLLPSLHSEMKVPGVLENIISQIKKTNYLRHVIIALGGAPQQENFLEAREFFGTLRSCCADVKIVWVDGPRMQGILKLLQDKHFNVGVKGKGQSVWLALGYILARESSDVICLHDCDIVTYDSLLLGRLVEPVANPNNDFDFSKGYYTRISPTEKGMKGRVTRLFVFPFLDIWADIMRRRRDEELEHFFRFHQSFYYPLAGEFTMSTKVAKGINIAYDWGLEVSTLSEVYNRVSLKKIAQVDLARNYEHKHQELSVKDPRKGLHRMVADIAKFFFSYVRSNGHEISDNFVTMLQESYYRRALNYLKRFSDDAESNQLTFDRYQEERITFHFAGFIKDAWEEMKQKGQSTQIPSWNRVAYSLPEIYEEIVKAVELDNASNTGV